jgi:hypothetical protein
MMGIILLLIGVFLGFMGNVVLVCFQFKGSVAAKRVDWVRDATEAFLPKDLETGQARNKYRYSLGVIIDDLSRCRDDGMKNNGYWPSLADKMDDRWDRFNRYVRPVVDDINNYAFLGGDRIIRKFSTKLRQLHYLALLCFEIENAVMRIDAAAENPSVIEISDEGISPISGKEDDPQIITLKDGFVELYQAWQDWLQVI